MNHPVSSKPAADLLAIARTMTDADAVAVDWLFAVRIVGIAEANRIEDYRVQIEHLTGRPCSYADAVENDKRRLT